MQSTLKVNVKQANVCTNGNAVGWLNKYVCRGGKNAICFLPTFHQICKVDQREIHLRRRKNILVQLWHFVFIELWSDYCLPLSKTHWLTHSCVLGLNYLTQEIIMQSQTLIFFGSLMKASNVCRYGWRSLAFAICKVKSNSCNRCVSGNVFIVQDWSSEDCWPSVNTRNIFPFQLRYMTWMADE